MEALNTEETVKHPRRHLTRAERAAQLRAQAAKLEQQEKAAHRKLDTRRKIVIGGMVLAAMTDATSDPAFVEAVRALLRARVTREHDRKAIADLL